ncbi:extracellular solute-binding protein [Vallitalea pronyensis]|uniref:Extracellular solute-binding protein n=1 Tax=Vallitalea pronyensis TaxID=1348613 RepID=A0A8J8MNS5_9FIRM|nr:extracellular solute-binding protein [Vallitalea pronyensis]QUI24802.1 extracellular solute-binding protein [Vallitalea pronyensis]
MKISKKLLSVLMILLLTVSVIAGCGTKNDNNGGSSNEGDAGSNNGQSSGSQTEDGGRKKIVMNLHNFLNNQSFVRAIEEMQTMDKYKNVDVEILDKDEEYETTTPIKLAAGQQMDILAIFNPILQAQWASAGLIVPLDDYIETAGTDFKKDFGGYAESAMNDGKTSIVPHNTTKWVLYYNKKIFDDAGVPYPDPDVPMTWDEYRETAAKLTSGEGGDKIYGALHMTWPMFWYGEAILNLGGGEHFYNEEGLSNIEDPIFSKALEDTYKMQHEAKSIPTQSELVTAKIPPQSFFNGKYGMFMQGPWLLNWAADRETYPRDWDLGIAPLPVDAGTDWKTWGVVGGLAVGVTSEHPQLAYEICMDLVRIAAKYASTEPEAIQTVEQPDLYVTIGEELSGEGLDSETLKKYFLAEKEIFVTEKVTGPNNAKYETVINEEVEKYFVGAQDLETTIKNIKERGNKVIQSDD